MAPLVAISEETSGPMIDKREILEASRIPYGRPPKETMCWARYAVIQPSIGPIAWTEFKERL
jgi:hypothetical protein